MAELIECPVCEGSGKVIISGAEYLCDICLSTGFADISDYSTKRKIDAYNQQLRNKDFNGYEGHLKKAGFTLEPGPREVYAYFPQKPGLQYPRIIISLLPNGIRFVSMVLALGYAYYHRSEYLELINRLNQESAASQFVATKDGSLAILSNYFNHYSKTHFNLFLSLWEEDISMMLNQPTIQKFLILE